MSAGWVLLVRSGDLSNEHDRAALLGSAQPVSTVTTDVRAGLALVGSGQAEGLIVASYSLLVPWVAALDQMPRQRRGVTSQREQPAIERRPLLRPEWTALPN